VVMQANFCGLGGDVESEAEEQRSMQSLLPEREGGILRKVLTHK